jgi:hypothetical protein
MTVKQKETIRSLRLEVSRLRKIEKMYLALIFRNDELITENKRLRREKSYDN